MKTRVTELLGIEYPIFQGSMANIATGRFAACAAESGALGVISGGGKTADQIQKEIQDCRIYTDKPFAVNIVLQPKETVPGIIEMLRQESVKIVITSAGDPKPWIPVMKQAGMQVLCVVADPAQAVKAEKAGADAVIAEGSESGGHIGEVHTMPLVPAVVYSVSIPVVAAGGIGDGRGMAAAFMLGAEAVQCGSAFLVTEECPIAAIYKQKVLDASVTDTIVTGRMLKDVVRSLRSPLSELTDELEKAGGERAYIRELGHGALRRAVEGDWEHGSFQVGQTAGLLRKQVTCRELVVHMMQEAQSAIQLQAELWTK